jgi:hypothetical protein
VIDLRTTVLPPPRRSGRGPVFAAGFGDDDWIPVKALNDSWMCFALSRKPSVGAGSVSGGLLVPPEAILSGLLGGIQLSLGGRKNAGRGGGLYASATGALPPLAIELDLECIPGAAGADEVEIIEDRLKNFDKLPAGEAGELAAGEAAGAGVAAPRDPHASMAFAVQFELAFASEAAASDSFSFEA